MKYVQLLLCKPQTVGSPLVPTLECWPHLRRRASTDQSRGGRTLLLENGCEIGVHTYRTCGVHFQTLEQEPAEECLCFFWMEDQQVQSLGVSFVHLEVGLDKMFQSTYLTHCIMGVWLLFGLVNENISHACCNLCCCSGDIKSLCFLVLFASVSPLIVFNAIPLGCSCFSEV